VKAAWPNVKSRSFWSRNVVALMLYYWVVGVIISARLIFQSA
jgi:hypothetical protein